MSMSSMTNKHSIRVEPLHHRDKDRGTHAACLCQRAFGRRKEKAFENLSERRLVVSVLVAIAGLLDANSVGVLLTHFLVHGLLERNFYKLSLALHLPLSAPIPISFLRRAPLITVRGSSHRFRDQPIAGPRFPYIVGVRDFHFR